MNTHYIYIYIYLYIYILYIYIYILKVLHRYNIIYNNNNNNNNNNILYTPQQLKYFKIWNKFHILGEFPNTSYFSFGIIFNYLENIIN